MKSEICQTGYSSSAAITLPEVHQAPAGKAADRGKETNHETEEVTGHNEVSEESKPLYIGVPISCINTLMKCLRIKILCQHCITV